MSNPLCFYVALRALCGMPHPWLLDELAELLEGWRSPIEA